MKRYHKKVYIPDSDIKKLQGFTNKLNDKNWRYTPHSIENLKYRHSDSKAVLLFIKDLKLAYEGVFEYYLTDTGEILKACYRVNYSENLDLILVIDKNKTLITIYINNVDDNHFTLNKNLYKKEVK